MTISEMPRNKANNPTQTSSSAPCTDRYCWDAQRPSTKECMTDSREASAELVDLDAYPAVRERSLK